jgi:hypothetical protein
MPRAIPLPRPTTSTVSSFSDESSWGSPIVIDQCQQAVVVRAARAAHGQMHGDSGEPARGVPSVDLGLDIALERRARGVAARVALIELENRFEAHAAAAIAR